MSSYGQRILLAVVIGASLATAMPVAAQQARDDEHSDDARRGDHRRERGDDSARPDADRHVRPSDIRGAPRAPERPVERRELPPRAEQARQADHGDRNERPQPQWRRGPEPAEGGRRWSQEPPQARQPAQEQPPQRGRLEQRIGDSRGNAERTHVERSRGAPALQEADHTRNPVWRDMDRVARERRQAEERGDRMQRNDDHRERIEQRLSTQQQRRLIENQQRQADDYRRAQLDSQRRAEQFGHTLRNQRRTSQYRYQNDYLRRLRDDHRRQSARRWDYYRDPFFYTPVSYRYSFSGHRYDTNRYGADLLREAVRLGYEEGYWAGRADRMDGWRPDYRNSYAYSDASYGYYGYYVPYDAYRYYFRQGFRRGYDDGYHGGYRYGTYRRGTPAILPAILAAIVVLEALD